MRRASSGLGSQTRTAAVASGSYRTAESRSILFSDDGTVHICILRKPSQGRARHGRTGTDLGRAYAFDDRLDTRSRALGDADSMMGAIPPFAMMP